MSSFSDDTCTDVQILVRGTTHLAAHLAELALLLLSGLNDDRLRLLGLVRGGLVRCRNRRVRLVRRATGGLAVRLNASGRLVRGDSRGRRRALLALAVRSAVGKQKQLALTSFPRSWRGRGRIWERPRHGRGTTGR